jgi:hypothetical protein
MAVYADQQGQGRNGPLRLVEDAEPQRGMSRCASQYKGSVGEVTKYMCMCSLFYFFSSHELTTPVCTENPEIMNTKVLGLSP